MRPAAAAVVLAGLGLLAGPAGADARADYLLHCAGCHLADGRGLPPEVPRLAGTLGRLVASPAGRDYLARVPGAAQAPIDDRRLAAVLNWLLLELNGDMLPVDFRPLGAAEVGRARQRVLADPLKLRHALWPADAGG